MAMFEKYEEFIENLKKKIKETLEQNKDFEPVVIEYGGKICKSWWGNSWCRNLERYADWENRIGRGKNYLRYGAVVDLKIKDGVINSRVHGGGYKPYYNNIYIKSLSRKRCQEIASQATGQLQNLEDLLAGRFPEYLKKLFFQEDGLFPNPEEIRFYCNCPDSANMCKHIAATLYGVGVRLDDNPMYFFQMRGINIDNFIGKAIGGRVEQMIANANIKSPRIIKNADLSKLFGID